VQRLLLAQMAIPHFSHLQQYWNCTKLNFKYMHLTECVLWNCRENPVKTIWRKHNTDKCGHHNLMRVTHKVSDPSALS
jgi:hypothetical protein